MSVDLFAPVKGSVLPDDGPVTGTTPAQARANTLTKMLQAYKIQSMAQVNALLQPYPELRPLADSMLDLWSRLRQQALEVAVDSLRHPEHKEKRTEFYRHIASTDLPSIDLVIGLRAHLLTHRALTLAEAKTIAIENQMRPVSSRPPSQVVGASAASDTTTATAEQQVEDEVILAVAEELVRTGETLLDVSRGVGYTDAKQPDKKLPLPAEDRLDVGWLAVKEVDGGQRLVLIELGAFRDVQRPCARCARGACTKRCGECRSTFYCSVDCQTAHWPEHKTKCNGKHKDVLTELRSNLTHDFQPIVITIPAPPAHTSKVTRSKKK